METEINGYVITIIATAVLFFISGLCALYWSSKKGHMQDFEKASKSIFTEDEPLDRQIDFFPTQNRKNKTSLPDPIHNN